MEVQTINTEKRISRLYREKERIEKKLRKLPKEHLIVTQNGPYWKWYKSYKNEITYIPKKKREFAQKLAFKKYLDEKLEIINNEIAAWNSFNKRMNRPLKHKVPNNEGYNELLQPILHNDFDDQVITWLNIPFEPNPGYPNNLNVKTILGTMVRSKSERDIIRLLVQHGIPFKYEAPLVIDGYTYYPDFTIMHPITHEIFYWEHCGKIDDISYLEDNLSKYKRYFSHGIIPSVNLILTFETKDQPFDVDYAEEIISYYFC